MTQLRELLPGIYCINVPMDASNFKIVRVFGNDIDLVFDTSSAFFSRGVRTLPDGSWSIICCSATATEEEAGKVVPKIHNYDPETLLDAIFSDVSVDTYAKTLASLIRSKGLDDKLNWLFLKLEI